MQRADAERSVIVLMHVRFFVADPVFVHMKMNMFFSVMFVFVRMD